MSTLPIASCHDVAAYILKANGTTSAMKLQKLVYYCQAWSLVWDDTPMFSEEIEAWANGPVVRELYDKHSGRFNLESWPDGDVSKLSSTAKETIDGVLGFYADHNAQALVDLTHREDPWILARKGTPQGVRGKEIITLESMMEYYSSI